MFSREFREFNLHLKIKSKSQALFRSDIHPRSFIGKLFADNNLEVRRKDDGYEVIRYKS